MMTREDIFTYICVAIEIHSVRYGGSGGIEDTYEITEDKTFRDIGLDPLDSMEVLYRLQEIIDFDDWGNELYDFISDGATIGEIIDHIISHDKHQKTKS